MSYAESVKRMAQAEKALSKIRAAREGLERGLADEQAKLESAIVDRQTALAAGKTQDLPRFGAVIENCRIAIKAATDDLEAISTAEHSALGELVRAEKAAQDALKAEWDILADSAKQELIDVAGPLLRRFWQANYNSNYPQPLGSCLTSAAVGLKVGIEDAALAAPDHDFGLPETIESSLLSHADRSLFQRHALG